MRQQVAVAAGVMPSPNGYRQGRHEGQKHQRRIEAGVQAIRQMVGDLDLRTEQGDRTKALLVMVGEANCPEPEPEPEKEVSRGQSEKICTTFLITRDDEPAAVELIQGWHSDLPEWPLKK
ncbi:hypothetical protein OG245_00825 [Streptomyces sp. NBC_01116]|uniref:hypothetical protein n=1 Tax=Streptomyces sp. NBC_01116 TaxID=2903752 RepID=UPI003243CDCC